MDSKSRKILIVDDEREIREQLCLLLRTQHYETIEAESGEKALYALTVNHDIALIILDLTMPIMGGLELMRNIRTHLELDLPIIVINETNEFEDVRTVFTLGAKDYVMKPLDKESFIDKVNHIIAGGHGERETYRRDVNFAALSDFTIKGYSAQRVILENGFALTEATQIAFISVELSQNVGRAYDHRYTCKVRECTQANDGDYYLINAEILGVPLEITKGKK